MCLREFVSVIIFSKNLKVYCFMELFARAHRRSPKQTRPQKIRQLFWYADHMTYDVVHWGLRH